MDKKVSRCKILPATILKGLLPLHGSIFVQAIVDEKNRNKDIISFSVEGTTVIFDYADLMQLINEVEGVIKDD